MLEIALTDRSGQIRTIEANPHGTLLQALRNGGDDDLLAICGGCCACATCHVYIDVVPADILPTPSPDEEALLEGLEYRTDRSRLSCQIKLSTSMSRLNVVIPPEE